jgi:GNAT superfamily N-acetyltransferase
LQVDDPDLKKLFTIFDYIDGKCDVAKHFGVTQYLLGVGLMVRPEYRGQGIATETLKARFPLLKVLGLKVTSAMFTMLGSQKAAAAAGYQELSSVSFEELKEKFDDSDFSSANSSHCKVFAIMID